ncbi:MAG: glycoside hydrolase family 76 protein, partial [Muribaculaceae bacterium]|nr:glycoside hydrolase family 76 protein [Muribaculaceae bacterium]
VDCGGPTGSFISYNTGTMISGAAELYRTTGDEQLVTDMGNYVAGSVREFGVESGRNGGSYEFNTDANATSGFTTWFNDVLIRSFVDVLPYADEAGVNPERYLGFHQANLDKAFENYNVGNLLPIHLRTGWGSEVKTKPFHQYSFASEYAILAKRLLPADETLSVDDVTVSPFDEAPEVYTLSGVNLGAYSSVAGTLSSGLYIVGNKKIYIKH